MRGGDPILNIYNSFTDGFYDEFYYGCETCGGADVPSTFTLTVVSDKFDDKEVSFHDFIAEKIPELAEEEL